MTTKIPTTNRILLPYGIVIYCSCDIVREVKDRMMRVNQRYAPLKDEGMGLGTKLKQLSQTEKFQNHFPISSRRTLKEHF